MRTTLNSVIVSLIGIMCHGCGQSQSDRSGQLPIRPEANAAVVALGPGDKEIRLPCFLDVEHTIDYPPVGQCYSAMVTPTVGSDASHYGPFRGLSGAPVMSISGEYLGVFSQVLADGDVGRYFGVLPRTSLEYLWTQSRRRVAAAESRVSEGSDHESVRPGMSVGIAWIWGDMISGVGGYVCERRGTEVVALGHSAMPETGPCSLALMHAPMIGAILVDGEFAKLSSWGKVIGEVDFNSELGVHANLGVAPKHVEIQYMLSAASAVTIVTYYVAKTPSQWGWAHAASLILRTTANDALRRVSELAQSKAFKLRVTGNGGLWSEVLIVDAGNIDDLAGIMLDRCFTRPERVLLEQSSITINVMHMP